MISASVIQYDALFRLANDATIVADAGNGAAGPVIIYVNPAFTRLTGYEAEEVIGQSPHLFLKAQNDSGTLRGIGQALRDNQAIRAEVYTFSKSGQGYWIDISIAPIHDPAGSRRCFLGLMRDITERKRMEDDLRRTQFALESVGDLAIWTRPDGRIFYVNAAACRALGRSRAELVGLSMTDIVAEGCPPNSRQCWDRSWENLKATGSATLETKLRRADGSVFPVEVTANYLRMADEEMNCAFGRDISERHKVQERLREADARLREALESIAEGFSLWDQNDRLVLFNERFRELFAPSSRIIKPGVQFETLLRANVANGCYGLTGDPEPWIQDRLARRSWARSGQEIHLAGGRRLRVGEHKTPRGFTVTVWVDITALKQAEQRLRDAIESVSEGFSLWDAEGRLVLCNSRYRDQAPTVADRLLAGAAFSDLLRRRVETGEYRIGSDPETWIADRLSLFRRGGAFEQELADGRWLLGSYRLTTDGGVVGIETDITLLKLQEFQLKASEEKLLQYVGELEDTRRRLEGQTAALSELAGRYLVARDAAEQASQAKSQFLAMMSHELRTPLNAIIGFSEMIEHEALGPIGVAKYVEYARDVRTSGTHLLDLINDILDMSKIEAGKYVIHRERIDPSLVVRKCLSMIKLRADEAGIRLIEDISGRLPPLDADERAVRQILLNLLSNAIKFTDRGGMVTIAASVDGQRLRISVSDTGIGIAPADLIRIGKPFEQIDSQHARKHTGTGLGLALSEALTELHGGQMTIESQIGLGTRVTVMLPLDESAPDSMTANADTASADGQLVFAIGPDHARS